MNKTHTAIANAVGARGTFQSALYRVVQQPNGSTEVTYRDTLVAIVSYSEAGKPFVYLNTGGWRTTTTKNVINAVLHGAGIPAVVSQRDYEWYIRQSGEQDFDAAFHLFDNFARPLFN